MLTAYLDETGQHKQGLVIVAGFIGPKEAWQKLSVAWPRAFAGSFRTSLHLKNLKFKHESDRKLLERLGPIPYECGLRGISGSVDENNYMDLAAGTVAQLHSHGYAIAMYPLVMACRDAVAPDERFELKLGEQVALGYYANRALAAINTMLPIHPHYKKRKGKSVRKTQLAGWQFMPSGSTFLGEPADYLCYHLAHNSAEPESIKSKWTEPIMAGGNVCIRHIRREFARKLFSPNVTLTPVPQDEIRSAVKAIRSGKVEDPWNQMIANRLERDS